MAGGGAANGLSGHQVHGKVRWLYTGAQPGDGTFLLPRVRVSLELPEGQTQDQLGAQGTELSLTATADTWDSALSGSDLGAARAWDD